MTTTAPQTRAVPPARPIVPQPLWERHRMFQEPAWPEGFELLEDDEEDGS